MKSNAIWYNNTKPKIWIIGPKKEIGSNLAFLHTLSISEGPDDNSNIWRCFDASKEWTKVDTNDVSIQCADEKAIDKNGKWSPKQFTAFERTFFDVSICFCPF